MDVTLSTIRVASVVAFRTAVMCVVNSLNGRIARVTTWPNCANIDMVTVYAHTATVGRMSGTSGYTNLNTVRVRVGKDLRQDANTPPAT